MIKVKLYATLAERSRSRKKEYDMQANGTLSVKNIVDKEFPQGWDEYIMAVVNGAQVELSHELKDGDQVELMLAVVGG